MSLAQQKADTQAAQLIKVDCTAFCPKCGADLYYLGDECICKNKDCSWVCQECKEES